MDINQLIKFLEFNTWLDYLIAIYLGSFVVQLFYYGFFFSRLAFFKVKEVNAELIPVSVIICAQYRLLWTIGQLLRVFALKSSPWSL